VEGGVALGKRRILSQSGELSLRINLPSRAAMRIKFFSKGRDEGRLNFAFHIQRRKLIALASLQADQKTYIT